jgi:uncharacterized protein (UPF0332 family)
MLREVEKKYRLLVGKSLKEGAAVQNHLKWQKAVNDLMLAEGLLKISTDARIKDSLGYPGNATFFDWVIICSYYSIFHSAQALLGLKRVKIISRVHHTTLIAFAKHFIASKEIEEEIYMVYEDAERRARELLDIFEEEKAKRGLFQYHRLSRNNLDPAKQSLENAKKFLDVVGRILTRKRII